MMKKLLIKLIATISFISICVVVDAQAKIVINGGIINISNGAVLIIDNPVNSAITYKGSGYIQSEGMNNRIIWNIGPGNGNIYLIPFGNAADYLPLQFNAASGIGSNGNISFSTYSTPTWKNSDFLPAGVTNVNHNGTDNSLNVIDRFWQINPQGYTTKPDLTNLTFTYSDNEYNAPNTITESNLIAQRWNTGALTWSDYIPVSTLNVGNNTVNISAVSGINLYNWWTLVDRTVILPVNLISFKASADNGIVQTKWQTASEQNTSYFEIWRGTNVQQFSLVGTLTAAGNSNTIKNYFFNDLHLFYGISYYKLKTVDKDGSFSWSGIASINIANNDLTYLYPNPAGDYISIHASPEIIAKKSVARLFDIGGKLLQVFSIINQHQVINISKLSAGAYHINIITDNKIQTLAFIKK
ncbi:MAG: T9SS type A sorting domain-containing protein [Ferruginibacter sp.]